MKHKTKGFTLIETLVSLFILSIAITASFAVISTNLTTATYVKNSFIASGLAQEGLEIARNLRDSDGGATPPRPFGSFGSADSISDGTYRVQWDSQNLMSGNWNSEHLNINSQGLYNYDGAADPTNVATPFYRGVTIERVSDSEIRVYVEVIWRGHLKEYSVSGEEHLYDWY